MIDGYTCDAVNTCTIIRNGVRVCGARVWVGVPCRAREAVRAELVTVYAWGAPVCVGVVCLAWAPRANRFWWLGPWWHGDRWLVSGRRVARVRRRSASPVGKSSPLPLTRWEHYAKRFFYRRVGKATEFNKKAERAALAPILIGFSYH